MKRVKGNIIEHVESVGLCNDDPNWKKIDENIITIKEKINEIITM